MSLKKSSAENIPQEMSLIKLPKEQSHRKCPLWNSQKKSPTGNVPYEMSQIKVQTEMSLTCYTYTLWAFYFIHTKGPRNINGTRPYPRHFLHLIIHFSLWFINIKQHTVFSNELMNSEELQAAVSERSTSQLNCSCAISFARPPKKPQESDHPWRCKKLDAVFRYTIHTVASM